MNALGLLLVGVGRMGRAYAEAARRLGVPVRATEVAERADGIAGLVDSVRIARGHEDELWAEGAWAAVTEGAPGGVVAFSEPQVIAAALIQERFGLAGPSLHAATLSRNKALQRGCFAAAGITQPEYMVTQDLASVREWVEPRLPVVVKALSSSGSIGVELVPDLAGYDAVATRRKAEGTLLVETAVVGPEYSWEALVEDGHVRFANTTAKETTGAPDFVEVSHVTGIQLPDSEAAQVARLGSQVVKAIGMRSGIVHLEFRLGPDGPSVMEVAVRTPGDFIANLLGLTYGFDWYEAVGRLAMGMPLPDPPKGPVAYAASFFPTVPESGIVTAVEGLAEVTAHRHVVQAEVVVSVGDIVSIHASPDRVGNVIISAPTPQEVDAALAFVRRTLTIRTGPAGQDGRLATQPRLVQAGAARSAPSQV